MKIDGTKICAKCGIKKLLTEFYKGKNYKDGYRIYCKDCAKELTNKYNKNHREERNNYQKEFYQNNKEYYIEYEKDQKQERLEYFKTYYQGNKEKYFAKVTKRRALKLNQTPIDAKQQTIEQLYSICQEINEILDGVYFHVDHIQPLSKGGSHHQDNLQILEAELNLKKSNTWPLTNIEQIKYKGYK